MLPCFMPQMSLELQEYHLLNEPASDVSANAKDPREAVPPPSTIMMAGERE